MWRKRRQWFHMYLLIAILSNIFLKSQSLNFGVDLLGRLIFTLILWLILCMTDIVTSKFLHSK